MATLYPGRQWWWAAWVVVALLLLDVLDLTVYGIVVPISALALAMLVPPVRPPDARPHAHEDSRRDLLAIGAFYVAVLVLFRLAFTVFTTAHVAGLFLCFGVVYAVAFAVVRSVFVLWPLLGSLYNNLSSGEIKLPWASIAGFVGVAMVMVAAIVWAARYRRRHRPEPVPLGAARAGGAAGVPPPAAG